MTPRFAIGALITLGVVALALGATNVATNVCLAALADGRSSVLCELLARLFFQP